MPGGWGADVAQKCVAKLSGGRDVHSAEEAFNRIVAAIRAWDSNQKMAHVFVHELEARRVPLDMVDTVSGMSLIHFAVRSGADGSYKSTWPWDRTEMDTDLVECLGVTRTRAEGL